MKTYEEIVKRVVEGQVRSFLHDHPEVLNTGTTTWKCPATKSRERQLIESISKRIVRDLTCHQTATIIKAALTGCTKEVSIEP